MLNPTTTQTLADLICDLAVDADRILLHPPPGTATEQDVINVMAHQERLVELVDGTLVEKAMGFEESLIAQRLAYFLSHFVIPRKLGVVAGSDGMIRLLKGKVRMPDVAYFSWSRFPAGQITDEAIPEIAPDIAVEVLSRSNTTEELERKRHEYFEATVRLVWIVDHRARTITVFTSTRDSITLIESDVLDGGDVLPGFQLTVSELFDV